MNLKSIISYLNEVYEKEGNIKVQKYIGIDERDLEDINMIYLSKDGDKWMVVIE
jgi:hypothetical protein